jgi:hypothetical protein
MVEESFPLIVAKKPQMARILQVSERTLTDWTREGITPCLKLGKGPQADVRYHVAKTLRRFEEHFGTSGPREKFQIRGGRRRRSALVA